MLSQTTRVVQESGKVLLPAKVEYLFLLEIQFFEGDCGHSKKDCNVGEENEYHPTNEVVTDAVIHVDVVCHIWLHCHARHIDCLIFHICSIKVNSLFPHFDVESCHKGFLCSNVLLIGRRQTGSLLMQLSLCNFHVNLSFKFLIMQPSSCGQSVQKDQGKYSKKSFSKAI